MGSQELPASVLYADLSSPSFKNFHRTISATAKRGKSSYRVRYIRPSDAAHHPLVVNGYGVELALKRTDYIVIDDRQADEAVGEPSEAMEASLHEENVSDLKPLASSELRGLSIMASSFAMSSDDPFGILLKLSQDFPKHSSALGGHNVSADFLNECRSRQSELPGGYNIVWINGVQLPPQQMDAFNLLEHLRRERKLITSVRSLGFSGQEAIKLLSHPAIAAAQGGDEAQRYDWRDDVEGGKVIMWLNNIEKDRRYEDWPRSISAVSMQSMTLWAIADTVTSFYKEPIPGSCRRSGETSII